jgi:hypothetical protein
MSKYGVVDVQRRGQNEVMVPNRAAGWINYIGQMEPQVAKRMAIVLATIDFDDECLRWGDPEDWSKILEEIGM